MFAIREHDHYSLRNTIRAGCLHECWLFLNELAKGSIDEKVRRDLADGVILGKYAYSTRMALWKIFRTRYLNISDPWVRSELISTSQYGPESPEFISLLYLYFILRDRLAFEFVTDVVWGKWLAYDLGIGSEDCSRFFTRLSQKTVLPKVTAESKGKLIRNTISTLQDFGLVTGTKHRVISRPEHGQCRDHGPSGKGEDPLYPGSPAETGQRDQGRGPHPSRSISGGQSGRGKLQRSLPLKG